MRHFLFIVLLLTSMLGSAQSNGTVTEAEKFYAHQQYDSALERYNLLLEEFPDTTLLYYNRGLCYYSLRQYEKAIKDFDQSLLSDSLFKDAWYAKALALEKKGDKSASRQVFNKLYAIDKNYDEVAKRIKTDRVAVYLSRNWYYMIAMAVLFIIFLATVITVKTSKRI